MLACMHPPQALILFGRRRCPLPFTWLRWFWWGSSSGIMTQLEGTLLVSEQLPSVAWCLVSTLHAYVFYYFALISLLIDTEDNAFSIFSNNRLQTCLPGRTDRGFHFRARVGAWCVWEGKSHVVLFCFHIHIFISCRDYSTLYSFNPLSF